MKYIIILFLMIVSFVGCSKVDGFNASSPSKEIILNLHNKERYNKKISLLQTDNQLNIAAQKYAEEMARTEIFEHGNVGARVGKGWISYGENIAAGQVSNEEVMKDWMNSRGHKRNILNKDYEYIGIGIATAKDGTIYWVVDFGSK